MLSGREGNEEANEGTSSHWRDMRGSPSSEVSESMPGGVTCSTGDDGDPEGN